MSDAPQSQLPEQTEPDWAVDERATLLQFLDYQRVTLERQAFGLTDEQAATASAPPSILTLTGLVRHMTEVERNWFRRVFRNEVIGPEYYTDERPDGDLEVDSTMSVTEAVAAWRAEVAISIQIVEQVTDMGAISSGQTRLGNCPNMRWILVHMIEEYARHCGHADLIRERIDGATDL